MNVRQKTRYQERKMYLYSVIIVIHLNLYRDEPTTVMTWEIKCLTRGAIGVPRYSSDCWVFFSSP